jgi:hypothetical protein
MAEGYKTTLADALSVIRDLSAVVLVDAPPPTDNAANDRDGNNDLKVLIDARISELNQAVNEARGSVRDWTTMFNRMPAASVNAAELVLTNFLTDTNYADVVKTGQRYLRQLGQRSQELATAIRRANQRLGNQPNQIPANDPNAAFLAVQAQLAQALLAPKVELPSLNLKHFSGKEDWSGWWSAFETSIHGDGRIARSQKFNYLSSLLDGEASRVIEGLSPTELNYPTAIALLTEKYGKEEETERNLFTQLTRLKTCNNLKELKDFHLSLEKICRQLESRGKGDDLESPLTYLSLEAKITKPMMREMYKFKKTARDDWNTTAFRKVLRELIDKEEELNSLYSQAHEDKPKTKEKSSSKKEPEANCTYAAVPNKAKGPKSNKNNLDKREKPSDKSNGSKDQSRPKDSERKTQPRYPCRFCDKEGHFMSDCKKFATVEARTGRIRELGRCLRCMRTGHMAKDCTTPVKPCYHCKSSHLQILCKQKFPSSSKPSSGGSKSAVVNAPENSSTEVVDQCGASIIRSKFGNKPTARIMMCKKLSAFNPNDTRQTKEALVFLDSGSHRSFVSKKLSRLLKLKTNNEEVFDLGGFAQQDSKRYKSSLVFLGLPLANGQNLILEANEMEPPLLGPIEAFDIDGVDIVDLRTEKLREPTICSEPDVLIGIDQFDLLDPEFHEKLPSGFALWKTKLGMHLCGRGLITSENSSSVLEPHVSVPIHQEDFKDNDVSLSRLVKRYFDAEAEKLIEGEDDESDQLVLEKFNQTIQLKDGRYQVNLPWNEKVSDLQANYPLAIGRLRSNVKALRRNSELMKRYHENLMELLNLNIIEKVEDPFGPIQGPLHYLPHMVVLRPDKPNKIRIVFDASSRSSKDTLSLNDCLSRGPVILPDLTGMLLRFRLKQIVLTCDLEKAFLQVAISPLDRDATRFLWLRHPFDKTKDEELDIFRFTAVTFGMVCSPFLLAAAIQHHADKLDTPLSKAVKDEIYVDNVMLGLEKRSDVLPTYYSLKELFASASMPVREFASNAREEIQKIPLEDRLEQKVVKVLGIKWNTETDSILMKLPKISCGQQSTKRNALAAVATTFDPLGLFSPLGT